MSDFERTQIGADGKRVIPGWSPEDPAPVRKAAKKAKKPVKKASKKK